MPKTISEIEKELNDAIGRLKDAQQSLATASRNETALINTVNGLQKEFDAAVEKIKISSLRSTDWGKSNSKYRVEGKCQ